MKFKGIYIWYAIPVVLITVWILAVYMPMSSRTKTKNSELLNVRKESQAVDSSISSILEGKSREEKIKASIKELESGIPFFDRFPDFIKDIIRSTKKFGVVITSFSSVFSTIDIKSSSVLITPAFEIGIKGRFMEISRFLEELENNRAFKGVTKAQLLYDEKEYPVLTGKFVVEFKSWRKVPNIEGK